MTLVKAESRRGSCTDDPTSPLRQKHFSAQHCEADGHDHMSNQDIHVERGIKTSDVRSSPHPIGELKRGNHKQDEQNAELETASLLLRASNGDDSTMKEEEQNGSSGVAFSKPGERASDTVQSNGQHNNHAQLFVTGKWESKEPCNSHEPAEFLLPESDYMGDDFTAADAATSVIGSEGPRIQAFAKLEFDDGQFYMNTYAVELGRDVRAARIALQQDLRSRQFHHGQASSQSKHRSNSSADGAQSSLRLKSSERKQTASSVMSETGGILNYDDYGTTVPRSRGAKSESSIQVNLSHQKPKLENSPTDAKPVLNDFTMKESSNGVQPVNPQALMPSPNECPLIPIHPPAAVDGTKSGHGGISRRHVRIAYNFERRSFEMEVKGRNGAFVDDQFYGPGELAELKNDCLIQIGNIGIRFILPKVARGDSSFEGTQVSEAQSAMSFDFEDGRGESIRIGDSSESDSSDLEGCVSGSSRDVSKSGSRDRSSSVESSEQMDDVAGPKEPENLSSHQQKLIARISRPSKKAPKIHRHKSTSKNKTKSKSKANPTASGREHAEEASKDLSKHPLLGEQEIEALNLGIPPEMIPPRRKGPGRPPKNGFMSKREEAALKKQMKEAAKARAVANGSAGFEATKTTHDVTGMEKRKYTKRKKADGQPDDTDVQESIEGPDQSGPLSNPTLTSAKPPKERRPKPPRSPSPFIDEASLTPEQLAKPQQSYVVLIHEALTNCPAGQMSLPQIYKAIERRYPHFKFKVSTLGWQSSIRHNLLQHAAFRKIERDGKGWMWGLVPEVSIEKEKRARRPSPVPLPPNAYYSTAPSMIPASYPHSPRIDAPVQIHGPMMYHTVPVNGFIATPTVRTHNGLALPLPQSNPSSTYQSPYKPAPQTKDTLEVNEGSHAASNRPPSLSAADAGAKTPSAEEKAQANQRSGQYPTRSLGSPQASPPCTHPIFTAVAQTRVYEGLSKSILDAIERFKSIMINKELAGMEHAEDIVNRAVKRVLGIQLPDPTQKEYPGETDIMKVLQNMLDQRLETERRESQRSERVQHAGAATVKENANLAERNGQQPNVQDTVQSHQGAPSQALDRTGGLQSTMASHDVESRDTARVIPQAANSQIRQEPQISLRRESTPLLRSPTLVPSTSPKPLSAGSPAEKDQVLSILKQLGQAPTSISLHSEHSSTAASAPLRFPTNSPTEPNDLPVVRGTKRRLSGVQDDAEYNRRAPRSSNDQVGSRGDDVEDKRPKRVAT